MIERSEAHRALTSADGGPAATLPSVDPDELADVVWEMLRTRDRSEVVHPAP